MFVYGASVQLARVEKRAPKNIVATLVVLQGPDKGRTFRTANEQVIVGRGSDEVPLSDRTVSRRHAELRPVDGTWVLADLNSANGTFINGRRIHKPVNLKHGDQIRVGSTLLVYSGDERIEQMSGANIPRDLVTLDAGSEHVDAAIMTSVTANEDSVVIAAPETAEAVKAWKVMRELTELISSLLPPDQLLGRILDIIFDTLIVDRGVVVVADNDGRDLRPEAVRYRTPDRREGEEHKDPGIIASRTILSHVIESREGVLCSNVITDRRFESGKSIQNLGMRSVICVPIVARERVLGVIHLDCPVTRHTYTEPELRLMVAVGHHTGLAIENARLLQQQVQRERLAAAGEAVAYLSHYIKNILQGMRAGSDVLKRGLERRDFAVTTHGWEILNRNLDKIYNLTANMLVFGKEREPRLELLQLNNIIHEVVDLTRKKADDARVWVLTDLDDNMPAVPLDYDGVHQVVLNLVNNAFEAIRRSGPMLGGNGADAAPDVHSMEPRPAPGSPHFETPPPDARRINIRSYFDPAAHHVIVSVTDNGPGVPEKDRARIFDAFHSTKGHGGTGLGLAAARKIVHEMGGSIELASPPEGGAEFIIRLPAYDARQPAADDTQGTLRP